MRRGFTLIELLVVITVIAILAGLLIPLISIALQKAREAKCQAKIANISAAITKYRDANGVVPDRISTTPGAFASQTQQPSGQTYDQIFGAPASLATVAALSAAPNDAAWEAAAENVVAQLATVDRDNFRSVDDSFRDPFGAGIKSKVFRYRPARYYPMTVPAASGTPDTYPDWDDPPNPDTFQLWSAGANGKDEYGSGDDLPNWKKKK